MKSSLTFIAASLAAFSAHAQTRGLDAHEHGHGSLNIAFEGSTVLMELEAPGADIVGFEHAAASTEDRAAIDAAVATLAKPLDLFVPDGGAGCAVTAAKVELVTEGGDQAGDHDDHGHKDHDHDAHHSEDHAEESHDKHDHEDHGHSDHADHDNAGHTEFHAEYVLTCADPAAIRAIDFAYFGRFPNAQELEVQLISEQGAKGYEVERDEPRLDLSGAI